MNTTQNPITLRGHIVLPKRPPGWITYAGPYRQGTEDWMLCRAINDARAIPGFRFLLCVEKAPERFGGFIGIALCRQSVQLQQTSQPPEENSAGEAATQPKQSTESFQQSPPAAQSKRPAK